jgi:hypothetical protein
VTSFILWVSRHDPIPAEREMIIKYPHSFVKEFIPTAEYLMKNYVEPLLKKYDKVYIIAILPESFKMRLLELVDDVKYRDRVFVVEPLVKELVHSKDVQECMNVYKKDTNKYVMITYGNGKECKVFEFEKFIILKQYIKIHEEWEHEDR